jgi:hypothetical protein
MQNDEATIHTHGDTEQIYAMILSNWRATDDEVANHLQVSHGSSHETIHNKLFSLSVCKVGFLATHKWPHVQMLGYLPALF